MKRALGRVVRSPHELVDLPAASVGSLLRLSPGKPVLVCGESGQALDGAAVERLSGAVGAWASRLAAPIATLLPNSLRLALTALGALRAGVPLAPAHPDLTPPEISRLLLTTGARCVVTTSLRVPGVLGGRDLAERVLGSSYPLQIVTTDSDMTFNGVTAFDDVVGVDQGPLPAAPSPQSTALLLESLGRPLRLTHANIVANCLQVSAAVGLKEGSVVAGVLPLYNGYGLIHVLINYLMAGARVVTVGRFQPKALAKAVARHGITVLPLAGDMLGGLGNTELSGLESLVVVVPPPGRRRLPTLPASVRLVTLHGVPSGPVLFHCGRPLPNTEVKVVDEESGEELEAGKEGRLWAAGPQLPAPGWTVTPDLGRYDAEGRFEVTGHTGDALSLHGLVLDPAEVETVLASHPALLDAGVYSESGSRETATAVLVPRDPASPPSLRDLRQFLAASLAPHKHVTNLKFANRIPRLPDGRTDRKTLAQVGKKKEFVAMSYI